MPEIKYKAFNSYIEKLIRAFNSRTAPIAIWSDSLFRYKEVEQEIESNIVFLTPEQCRNYIGGLIRQVEKNINTIHDNSEAVKQFLQAGNYSEEAMDEARMSAKIVPDAFIDDIPTNAQLKYEGYTDDDITNGRMLQQYYVRKRLGWLNNELKTKYLTVTGINAADSNLKGQKSNKNLPEAASFGFTGDPAKLLTLLKALQLRMRKKLIKEAKCTIEDLHVVLTTDTLSGTEKTIWFSCETTQLAYLLRKLKPFFTNFEDDLIESSQLFITSKGSNLSAQNIRKSYSETPEPKDFEVIDQLIAELSRS